jgi:hypothetical protein
VDRSQTSSFNFHLRLELKHRDRGVADDFAHFAAILRSHDQESKHAQLVILATYQFHHRYDTLALVPARLKVPLAVVLVIVAA